MANSKWQDIHQDLLNRISRGNLAGKGSLPSEEVLAEQYHCSRPTLRKAVAELKRAGYITSVQGSGLYINASAESGASNTGTAKLLGIIFPNMGPGYLFDPLSSKLAQYTAENGYSLIWGGYISPRSEDLKLNVLQICELYCMQKIEGLFFAPFEYHASGDFINKEILQIISHAGIPVVLVDSIIKPYPAASEFDLVSMDHIQAAYILTVHLVEQGFRRIAFISTIHSHHAVKLRFMGCREALLDHGLAAPPFFETSMDDFPSLSRFIQEKKPEAIVCSNDITAMNLIQSIEKLGLKVPADIAVAGFDNLSRAMPFSHVVTSIEQPVHEIGHAALSLMTSRIANPHRAVSQITFPGRLVIGDTTART